MHIWDSDECIGIEWLKNSVMMTDIWTSCLHIIRDEVGSRVVETWFKAVMWDGWDAIAKTVYLRAPNSFVQEWVCKHYLSILQTNLGRLLNIDTVRIVFVTGPKEISKESSGPLTDNPVSAGSGIVANAKNEEKRLPAMLIKQPALSSYGYVNRSYLFDTFVVGPSNSLSYAAAHAVTEKPGCLYNPLFIYGGSGLGKTHLLHAIGNEIKGKNKDAIVLYQTADRFVNEFISAIRFDRVHKFQVKYQAVDVLLIDDIQFISNKEQTQEAFFHIFNSLYDAHKQIVFSSDTVPYTMSGIAERLRSRLGCGLVTDIHIPRLETKIAILKKKAALSATLIPDEVAYFIASRVISNIRELEGALIRVMAFASLTQQAITVELSKKVLNYVGQEKKTTVDFDTIVTELGRHFSCDRALLLSHNRSKDIALVRQVGMFLMKKMTDKSLRDIGAFFGGRNHATVMHAISRVEQELRFNQDLEQKIKHMESSLTSRY